MTETDLRWRLRQLPRELEPGRDLWHGIAANLQRPPVRSSRRWLNGLAIAASLTLAIGLGWRLLPATTAPVAPATVAANTPTLPLQHEASALTREYRAALREFVGAPVPEALSPSLQVLDDSAEQIRAALAAQPDSPALLQQLRKTYSRRLALTQRALTG